jgi:hypothetical protein
MTQCAVKNVFTLVNQSKRGWALTTDNDFDHDENRKIPDTDESPNATVVAKWIWENSEFRSKIRRKYNWSTFQRNMGRWLNEGTKPRDGNVIKAIEEASRAPMSDFDKLRPKIGKPTHLSRIIDRKSKEVSKSALGSTRPFHNAIRWPGGASMLEENTVQKELSGAPESTTYGFRYSGVDMEPEVPDGATIWVLEEVKPYPGDLLIFEPRALYLYPLMCYVVYFVGENDNNEWIVNKQKPQSRGFKSDENFYISKEDWPTAKGVNIHKFYHPA